MDSAALQPKQGDVARGKGRGPWASFLPCRDALSWGSAGRERQRLWRKGLSHLKPFRVQGLS